jgi:hypothetical protein
MQTKQIQIKAKSDFDKEIAKITAVKPNFVLLFGTYAHFESTGLAVKVSHMFPEALVIGCSTAGEISNDGVSDDTMVVTGCRFDHPDFKPVWAEFSDMEHTIDAGRGLANKLEHKNLSAVFLLGRGLDINGSALIEGLREVLGSKVTITGGLAGDGGRFQKTYTLLNGTVSSSRIVGFGIYGDSVKVAFGSMGGWEPFGPVRRVTKAKQNILFELDGEPALDIYKKYLGDKAKELPASGLLYPFAILKDNQDTSGIIRTILAVDENERSLTFAGDIPVNGLVRLMHASNQSLVKGAKDAAVATYKSVENQDEEGFGVLISCVGRKLIMGNEIEDELDAVRDTFGESTIAGFYSYGEICAQTGFSECKLHNQTMTITYFSEGKKAA